MLVNLSRSGGLPRFPSDRLYAKDGNAFVDAEGKKRPLVRDKGKVLVYYQQFSDMEIVMGRGGQLGSFEAVFSPRGSDGKPLQLWDRKTGTIDPAVAKEWEKYDIRLILERNWKRLTPAGIPERAFLLCSARKKNLAGITPPGLQTILWVPVHPSGRLITLTTSLRKRQEAASCSTDADEG
jgi:hypothetical protein